MDKGDTFHTLGGGHKARVTKDRCAGCGDVYLRTHADDTKYDNLDNLRTCSWKSQ